MFASVPQSECYYEYDQIHNELQNSFFSSQYIFIIIEGSFTIVGLFLIHYFATRIVAPLKLLANSSKELTNQDKGLKAVTASKVASHKKISLEEIFTKDSDIDVLLHSFKKLVKDLSGFKKGTRKEGPNLEDHIEYPQKDYKDEGQVESAYQDIELLQDLAQFQSRLEAYAEEFKNLGDILRANNIVDSLGEEGVTHALAQGLTKAHGEGQRFQESAKGSEPDRDIRNDETRNTGFREDRKASDSYSFNADLKIDLNKIIGFQMEQQNNIDENEENNEEEAERGSNENTEQPRTHDDEDSQTRGKYHDESDYNRSRIELRDVLFLQMVIHNLSCIFDETLHKTKKLLLKKSDRQLYMILQTYFFYLSQCYKHVDIIDIKVPVSLDSEGDENLSEQGQPEQKFGLVYKPEDSQGILLELILSFHDLKYVPIQAEGRVTLRKVKLFHTILPREKLD